MPDRDGIRILSDEPLLGPAAFVEQHAGDADQPLAEALRDHALATSVGVPAARGPIDAFLRIVQRLRGRTLVEDLGEHDIYVTWLTSHVPPGGNCQLHLSQQAGSGFGVKLGVMGLGLGSGRSLTLATEEKFGKRDKCMQIQQKLRVAVRTYRQGEANQPAEVQTDVVKTLGQKVTTLDDCPLCFSAAADCPDLAEPIEEKVHDLTDDVTGKSEKTTVVIENDAERELGLKLPLGGLEITPSLAVKRSVKLSCSLELDFPGGYRYTPYHLITEWEDLPFWGRS